MDTIVTYRQIIEQILTHYVEIPYAYGEIENETVFDRTADRYMVLSMVVAHTQGMRYTA